MMGGGTAQSLATPSDEIAHDAIHKLRGGDEDAVLWGKSAGALELIRRPRAALAMSRDAHETVKHEVGVDVPARDLA